MDARPEKKAIYHLPGLFEFYDFYEVFLPLFYEHREYFYEWCEIGSIYGSPEGALWNGGRTSDGTAEPEKVLELLNKYGISPRLTFSNSLIEEKHLTDAYCNSLCAFFEKNSATRCGIIVHSDLLLDYLGQKYPDLYYVSSTTKVLTDFADFEKECARDEFDYVVPDFRLNKAFDRLGGLSWEHRRKVEFLCNECCYIGCADRKLCYDFVSLKNLFEDCPDFVCRAPHGSDGYVFSRAMENPSFIGTEDIRNVYLPMGFTNFKIEGRGLGNAMILEFLLYYMTRPECHLKVREAVYLDGMLDLF